VSRPATHGRATRLGSIYVYMELDENRSVADARPGLPGSLTGPCGGVCRQELQQARAAVSSAERVRDDARNLDPEAFDRIRSSMDAAELRRDTAGETLETDGSAEMGPSTLYGSGSIGEVRKRQEALLALRDEVQAAGQEARGAMAATAGLERREQEVAGARDPQGAQMETLTRMEAQGQVRPGVGLGRSAILLAKVIHFTMGCINYRGLC
jgi:hypothetical protein